MRFIVLHLQRLLALRKSILRVGSMLLRAKSHDQTRSLAAAETSDSEGYFMRSSDRFGLLLIAVLLSVSAGRLARAQCEDWIPGFGSPGIGGFVYALTSWDPDGQGPMPSQVVAGGLFDKAGGMPAIRIARWNGTQWLPLGTGIGTSSDTGASVRALTTWDPDGDGPLFGQLVAGGIFSTAGGAVARSIARWDGAQWHAMGSGFEWDAKILALAAWDPDGTGPEPAQLIAGGDFTIAGGVAANHIARWDGSAWHALGEGTDDYIAALTICDPDGSGPLPDQLIAGGAFTTAGGTAVNGIARWDGSHWLPVGDGTNGGVLALTKWDPDGSGPLQDQLIAGGSFTTSGGTAVNRIARWDGTQWLPLGIGIASIVSALTTWDPDGSGPGQTQLVAGGQFTSAGGVSAKRVARWDGSQWLPAGTGLGDSVLSLATWDPDADGPQAPVVVAGGTFESNGVPATVNRIARWDGARWRNFGEGLSSPGGLSEPQAFTSWDPDGSGPLEAQLVAGGRFRHAGGWLVNRIATWDGTQWHSHGTGSTTEVGALSSWDADGEGPLAPHLIAGGVFSTAAGPSARRVARWDGSQWHSFGSGLDPSTTYVASFASWDPDATGPLSSQLVAGGSFTTSGTVTVNRVAVWDGAQWLPLGSGVDRQVNALVRWDPDDSGPQPSQLIAGGYFETAGGVTAEGIARWDGAEWQPLGTSLSGNVERMAVWDPDQSGPLPPQLVVGGDLTSIDGVTVNNIVRWDGSQWHPLGSGVNDSVWALTTWDPDGPGPRQTEVVAGGRFKVAGGKPANFIARWDGTQWLPLGDGTGGTVTALSTWDPDGSGPLPADLIVGGSFLVAGSLPAGYIARYSGVSLPRFELHPTSQVVSNNDTLVLMAIPTVGYSGISVRWQRNGVDIFDGPGGASPIGGIVSGASRLLPSPTYGGPAVLTIQNVRPTDAGEYTAVFFNACGSVNSEIATIDVTVECPSDLNGDTLSDILDFLEFIDAFSACELQPAPCASSSGIDADFNADTFVDILDFLDFIDAFGTGCT